MRPAFQKSMVNLGSGRKSDRRGQDGQNTYVDNGEAILGRSYGQRKYARPTVKDVVKRSGMAYSMLLWI